MLDCGDVGGGAVSVLPTDHWHLDLHGNAVVMKTIMCARHYHAVTVDEQPWRYDPDDGTVIVIAE